MVHRRQVHKARGWLEQAKAPQDRVDELVAASVLATVQLPLEARVADVGGVELGVDVEMAVVELAEARDDVALLVHLRDHGQHKQSAKQAKKLLFRAKQRGAAVPEDSAPSAAVSLSQQPDPLQSVCSTFNSVGAQVVVLGGWDERDGSWALVGFMHQERGLESVAWIPRLSRSRMRSILDDLRERRGGEMIVVPAAVAAQRLRWALETAERVGTRIDGDKSRVNTALEGANHELDPVTGDTDWQTTDAEGRCAAMVDDVTLEGWLPSLDTLLDGVEAQLKTLHEEGSLEWSVDAVGAKAAALLLEIYDDQGRAQLAMMLDVNAQLMAAEGRKDNAICAATVAEALRQESAPLALTFTRALIDRQAPPEDMVQTDDEAPAGEASSDDDAHEEVIASGVNAEAIHAEAATASVEPIEAEDVVIASPEATSAETTEEVAAADADDVTDDDASSPS